MSPAKPAPRRERASAVTTHLSASMGTTARVPIRELVALATRAPSVHNTQPWRWCVAGDQVALFADYSRQLIHADPAGRDLVISCGAALHHLQASAAAMGWKAHVRRMPN